MRFGSQPLEVGPEARIGLGDAAGVEDRHAGNSQPGQGERHGHAMVIVGGDARSVKLVSGRAGRSPGRRAAHRPAHPAAAARVASAAIRSVSLWRMWATLRIRETPSAKRATNGQRHDRVGNRVHVDVDGAQPPADHGGACRLALDGAAHVFEHVDKRHVSLNARRAESIDGDRPRA